MWRLPIFCGRNGFILSSFLLIRLLFHANPSWSVIELYTIYSVNAAWMYFDIVVFSFFKNISAFSELLLLVWSDSYTYFGLCALLKSANSLREGMVWSPMVSYTDSCRRGLLIKLWWAPVEDPFSYLYFNVSLTSNREFLKRMIIK